MKGFSALAVVALLLAAAGGARAAEVQGDLVLDGPLLLRDGGVARGPALALFIKETEQMRAFDGTFPTLTVTVTEATYARATDYGINVETTFSNATYVLHDVRVSLARSDPAGWLGAIPADGSAIAYEMPPASSLLASGLRKYGNSVSGPGGDPRGQPLFNLDVDVPHVLGTAPGVVTLEGPVGVAILGLDVVLAARENTTTVMTGQWREEGVVVGQHVQRSLYLEFDAGVLRMDSGGRVEVALAEADVAWSGLGTFRPREGTLTVGADDEAHSGVVTLDGELLASLRVALDSDTPRLRAAMSGTAVRVAPAPRAAAEGGTGVPLPLVLVALAALAGGGVWLLARRRGGGTPLDVDELVTLAHLAGEGGRHDEALGWIRRARGVAPTSGALALEEAFHLGEMGRVAEALACYEDAARVLGDGQAEFDAALLAHRSGALPQAEVERLLVDALERNPSLVLELGDLDRLRLRPSGGAALATAVRRARRRLDEG